MLDGVRRVLAGLALAVVLCFAAGTVAVAETAAPTPISATESAAATDTADAPQDRSNLIWALTGTAAVAALAGALVFLRRR